MNLDMTVSGMSDICFQDEVYFMCECECVGRCYNGRNEERGEENE